MKRGIIRLTALAAALCMLLPKLPIKASAAMQQIGVRGDVDTDGTVGLSDVYALLHHLTGEAPLTDPDCMQFADMDQNGRLNAVDLTLLKRLLLSGEEPEKLYIEVPDPEPELIDPPIAVVKPTLPCVGENRIPLFAVDFPDCHFEEQYSAEQIKQIAFGEPNPSDPYYPLESISAYYARASYGRLRMEGDVYLYTAKSNIQSYYGRTDSLVNEILAAFDDMIDYRNYDINENGILDTVIVAVPESALGVDTDGDGIGACSLRKKAIFNNTWVHELGHAMGLPDYYKYENTQDGYFGLNGDAGWEMMDDAFGDMSAFSKLMYGWYDKNEIQIYTGGTQTFTLRSSQDAPGLIVIPRGDLNGYLSEFFTVEYATPTGNNTAGFYEDTRYTLFGTEGVRILHCDSEIAYNGWNLELAWNNYGVYYDSSNQKQRVLRLVNEKEGGRFFRAGKTVDGSISGFHWYDDSGWQTVDPGITVTVDSIADGVCTVTISANG